MKNKNTKKLTRFFKKYRRYVVLLLLLFVFPIIVGLIYAIPIRQVVMVDSGDLLAYYGTTFGIVGSFITYRLELNKRKKERIKELKPAFIVEVKKIPNESNVFEIEITNRSKNIITFLYFYEEFVSADIKEKYSFKTTFNETNDEVDRIKPNYNITSNPDIIDADGYPEYIQLTCNDCEGNNWNCCYFKVKDCDKIYYYPRDFEVI